MPDVTDQILVQTTPDPRYHPLPPTVGKLEEYEQEFRSELAIELECYADDLEYHGNQITYEWATNEILGHQMNWVRVGLVAERIRRYRIYKPKFPDWRTYCRKVLGKEAWQMKHIINAALATMELIHEGFDIVPSCTSQAKKLLDCCRKGSMKLIEAWESVIEQLPAKHLITANAIAEALGFASEKEDKLPPHLRTRIAKLASRDGMSFEDKLEEMTQREEEEFTPEPEPEPKEDELDVEDQLWHQEMVELVKEHDHQIWFLGAITRVSILLRKSQYGWLKQLRYQT